MWATTEESIPSLALASVCTCLHTHSHTQHTNTQKGGKEKNFWKNKMIDDGRSETPVQHLLLTNIQSREWGGRLNFIKSEERIPANSINKDNNPSQEVSQAQKPCSLTRQEARNPHNIHIGKGSPFLTNTVLQPRATLIGDALRMCGLLSGVRNDCLLLALKPQGISAVVTQWVTVSHESNLAQQSN